MRFSRLAVLLGAAAVLRCSPDVAAVGADKGAVGASSGGGQVTVGSGQGGAPSVSASGSFDGRGGFDTSAGGGLPCRGGADDDLDADGFTPTGGDCNDCDPMVGPNAVEAIGRSNAPPVDDDCDGLIDEIDPPCDAGFAIDDADPIHAAHAIELCKLASGKLWGLLDAVWVLPDGTAPVLAAPTLAAFHLGHGLLPGLGPYLVPQDGERVLALSSGTARAPTDPGYIAVEDGYDKAYVSGTPSEAPLSAPSCPMAMSGGAHDGIALALKVRTPANALGFAFDFQALGAEWPNGVCTPFDDAFIGLLSPAPMGAIDGNVVFDQLGNPVTINNAWFDYCTCAFGPPCEAGGKLFDCPFGAADLGGTGFDAHASTGWLEVSAPIDPSSEMELRLTVFDAGDGLLDLSAVVDGFRWITSPGGPITTGPDPG